MTVSKSLGKGAYLFYEGGPVHGIYIVQSGAIKLSRTSSGGKEQVLHIFRAGESFGEDGLVSEAGNLADARAVQPSFVWMIQKAGFLALVRRKPALVLPLLRALHEHQATLMRLLDDLAFKDVNTRLANWLIEHCPDPHSARPCCVEPSMPMNVLAAELGTASETFSRALTRFRKENLVSTDRNKIVLLQPSRLTSYVEQAAPLTRFVFPLAAAAPCREKPENMESEPRFDKERRR
ncbi:MAG: Crp/Fnr family transcriptional regulator [Verrucomicrobia bacterium]|nr:Crp/Fnr family transcriptional regulator [Verrucomicrobiota bacterium]